MVQVSGGACNCGAGHDYVPVSYTHLLEVITQAKTAAEVTSGLAEGQNSIDAVIDQIPEAGAWDGKTLTEPAVSERGFIRLRVEVSWLGLQIR